MTQNEMGHSPVRRVALTPRDQRLMAMLYEGVALSFPQIGRKAFQGRDKSTVLNRLARLEAGGLIKRMRIPGFVADAPREPIRVVFQLTRSGIRELSKWQGSLVERDEPIRIHALSLSHDLLLVDLADALRDRFPGARVLDGRLWKGGTTSPNTAKPDLLLDLPGGERPWAIELELTAKSEKRYREVVLRYRLSKDFDRVVYVTDQSQVVARLLRVLDGKFLRLGSHGTSKFAYTSLEELLNHLRGRG